MLTITCRNDILQVHIGRIATFLDKAQETIEITLFQGFHLLGHTGIFFVEMVGSQHSPVTKFFPKGGDGGNKVFFVDLSQDILAEVAANCL